MKKITLALAASLALVFASCSTTPKNISEDLSYPEIIQYGQTAFDSGNYKLAIKYFENAIDRFGESAASYVEAKYEIAHVYMRWKKYDKAEPILNEIREIYLNSAPGALPAAYDKLAAIELDKIPD